VPSLTMKQASFESSGKRPHPKAVVSVMPVVSAKASARITAIFFMTAPLFCLCADCQNRARTSVIAITFWSFLVLRLRQASEGKRGYEASLRQR